MGRAYWHTLLEISAFIRIFSGPTRESPLAVSGAYSSTQCMAPRGHPIISLTWDSEKM